MATGRRIGIDLGTTNSVVAVLDGPQPRVLESREGRPQVPSVVGLRRRKKGKKGGGGDGEVLVGSVAYDNWPMAPKDTIVSVKRLMGRRVADADVQKVRETFQYEVVEPSDGTKDSVRVVMGGEEYSPVDISARILRKMKEDAEFRLNEPVTHAVITVPAYFNQRQKGATREAGRRAGLHVMKVLEEPTAAAVAYGIEQTESSDPKYILVYDLGGGTFDISILMWAGNVFAPINLQGDMWLGGDNFDQILVDHALAYVREEFEMDPTGDERFMVALRKAARETKERLTSSMSADLIVSGMLRDEDGDLIDVDLEVTRQEYERMIRPLVDRTVSIAEKALENAQLSIDQIDHVLMAGNGTRVPIVQQAMEAMFGKERILRSDNPKHSVSLGAAIVASRLKGILCQAPSPGDEEKECGHWNPLDAAKCENCGAALTPPEEGEEAEEDDLQIGGIANLHYGIQTADDAFHVFIQKGDPYPTDNPKTQTFHTQAPNQRMISIPVYGGEQLEKASLNEKQGEAFAVLPPDLPKGAVVRITVWLDGDGVFDLSAHLEDGRDLEPLILAGEKDQKAVEAIEQVEQILDQKAASLPASDMERLEQTRRQAFDALKKREFDRALDLADQFGRQVHEAEQAPERDQLRTKAESLIGFAQFVLHEYGWAMDAEKSYALNRLVDETRQALDAGDRQALESKVAELDRATDDLPNVVKSLLAFRGAIQNRVRPVDPVAATNLMDELEEVERGIKRNDPSAVDQFKALEAKIAKAIAQAGPGPGGPGQMPEVETCPICGKKVQGRYCENGHDQWGVVSKGSHGTSGDSIA